MSGQKPERSNHDALWALLAQPPTAAAVAAVRAACWPEGEGY